MGSVKDLVTEKNAYRFEDSLTPEQQRAAVKLYSPAEPHKFGMGAWVVSGRFSVGDLKDKIPPLEIPQKGVGLAMSVATYWEHAERNGLESCYVGMLARNGEVMSVRDVVARGETSNVVVMELANIPKAKTAEALQEYQQAVREGDMSVYVADAESIFRRGLPLGSSVFKKLANAAGRGSDYERVATYQDTVALLDEMRSAVSEQGIDAFPQLKQRLDALGLDEIPNPGYMLPETSFDFTTKFALSGDEEITEEDAIIRIGAGRDNYFLWKEMVRSCEADQTKFDAQRGIINLDGKLEAVVYVQGFSGRKMKLTDFANTPDENRLGILHGHAGEQLIIPTNKEIQRAVFRDRGIYTAIDKAKAAHGDQWLGHIHEYVSKDVIQEATETSIRMMANAIGTLTNRLLGENVIEASPLEEWVDEFVPFSSRVQVGQEDYFSTT